MRIAIVVPTYNRARFLERTLESVRAQSFGAWGLVVVDDGSSDGSAVLAQAYADQDPRVRVVCQENAGVGAARNRGLAESDPQADAIIFLDSDDVWEADALERLAGVLAAHPEAVAAGGLARIINEEGELCDFGELEQRGRFRWGVQGSRLAPWPLFAPTTFAVLAYKNCIYTPGQLLIRRGALAATGLFDAALCPADDWDYWLRLSRQGEIAFLDRVVLNWRTHADHVTRDKAAVFAQHVRVRQKLLAAPDLTVEQRRIALLANAFWARHVASLRLGRARQLLAYGERRLALEQVGAAVACLAAGARGAAAIAPQFPPTIRELYHFARSMRSDIRAHLDPLRCLARHCRHVTELGTGGGISTTALLAGYPRALITYDRERFPPIADLERAAQGTGRTRFQFRQADVLQVEIADTELLFIDTRHDYEQLRQELTLHAPKARRYLVLHGTTTFGQLGPAPGSRGLWPAIEEFLQASPQWALAARLEHSSGLTILARRGTPVPAGALQRATRPAPSY